MRKMIRLIKGTKLLDNNNQTNLDENNPIFKFIMDKYSEILNIGRENTATGRKKATTGRENATNERWIIIW